MNRVAIIVLNYKGIDDTIACLASLDKLSHPAYTMVVVENGSHDGSAEKINELERQYGDKLVALYNQENLGFAGGVNTGIKWALEHKYEYVALFNNDAVADPEWLTALEKAIKLSSDIGIATGLLLHEDGKTIDSTGDWYSTWGLAFPRNRGDHATLAPNSDFVFGATGGATLYKATLLKTIGLFDDDFFAYYEDADISFRAQLAGYKVAYTTDAIAYHKQGATSSKIPGFAVRQTFKNLPLLFWKNVPRSLLFPIGIRFFFAYLLMFGNTFTHGTGGAATRGVLQSFILLPAALKKRRTIQSNKKVTDAYIKSLLWADLPPDQTGIRKVRKLFTGK